MSSVPPRLNGQPEIRLTKTETYRENYANSVQVRMSVWDVQLVFATLEQNSPELVVLEGFQGIYMSPQQAKALSSILTQNIAQYESTFGVISLEPQVTPAGGVN
jgi:hypothetical protein